MIMKIVFCLLLVALAALLFSLSGCTGVPEGLTVVKGFQLERYLGKWYEIARLDHSFERGLSRISAEYTRRDDGGVRVINRGWNAAKQQWKEAEGKAYPLEGPDAGRFKVSFFGPFYGGYNIIALDKENYAWALVCGPNRGYFWLLARSPKLDPALQAELVQKAKDMGFATDKLIFVEQE